MPKLNAVFCLLLLWCLLLQCKPDKKASGGTYVIQGKEVNFPDTSKTHQLDGQALTAVYCQACHAYPEPALLSRNTWKQFVLPNMAMRLGVNTNADPYSSISNDEIQNVVQNQVYPFQRLISLQDWQKIEDFYLNSAPRTPLSQEPKTPVSETLPGFSLWIPASQNDAPAVTTLVYYNEAGKCLYIGDRRQNLLQYNKHLQQTDSIRLPSPPSFLMSSGENTWLLTMGIMDPSDAHQGQLLVKGKHGKDFTSLLTRIPRPVHLSVADLNADSRQDYIVSGFGNQTGRLSWFSLEKDTSFTEHILKPVPGALHTAVHDFNRDGLPDLLALFAQGDEQICIFYNKGKGNFEEKQVLRFPPVYGSSYVELADFNHDGAPDILYTNGDNADYSISLKKYHGVRVFMNDGRNNFAEEWFYPMHGATKAIARDFNKDGDLDIAAIAFFPDFDTRPEESFVYFRNEGNNNFKPFTKNITQLGRWLAMDAGDVDEDGFLDIILGSFILSPSPAPQHLLKVWKQGPPFVILRNEATAAPVTEEKVKGLHP